MNNDLFQISSNVLASRRFLYLNAKSQTFIPYDIWDYMA